MVSGLACVAGAVLPLVVSSHLHWAQLALSLLGKFGASGERHWGRGLVDLELQKNYRRSFHNHSVLVGAFN